MWKLKLFIRNILFQNRTTSKTKYSLTSYNNTYRFLSKDKLPNMPSDIDEIWFPSKDLRKSGTKLLNIALS